MAPLQLAACDALRVLSQQEPEAVALSENIGRLYEALAQPVDDKAEPAALQVRAALQDLDRVRSLKTRAGPALHSCEP